MGVTALTVALCILVAMAFYRRTFHPVAGEQDPPARSAELMTTLRAVAAPVASASAPLVVYGDGLENGWMERGFARVIDYHNASPVRGSQGSSIRVESGPYEALKVYNPVADVSHYKYLVFYVNGGAIGGQMLRVQTVVGGKTQGLIYLQALPAEKWARVVIPLDDLGVLGRNDLYAFWMQNTKNQTAPPFYVDDIQFCTSDTPSGNEPNLKIGRTQP